MKALLRNLPPTPWDRWEDGEPVGWDVAVSLWKSYLLPYRTAEYLGHDPETFELILGPWRWHKPHFMVRP